jgi:tetratricopeptide (TPR) repeat protein
LNDLKRHDEAIASCDKAIALNPRLAEAYSNRGIALDGLRRHDEALRDHDTAIALKPDLAAAYSNRGIALNGLKRHDEAIASCDKAIALNPDFAEAYSNRGIALNGLRQYEKAITSCDKAIALSPGLAEAYSNRGAALSGLKRHDEAIASCDKAIALKPDFANAYNNRAFALQALKRYDEAIASFDKAIVLEPEYVDAHWNGGLLKILLGKYEEGWKLYEWRWKREDVKQFGRKFKQPLWLGDENLAGKTILLHAEQGLGDAILSSRYVSIVEAMGARVIVEVPSPLAGLISTLGNSIRVVHRGSSLPDFDFHCPLMSLPLAFKTTVGTIPARIPYLAVDPIRKQHWQERLGPKVKPRIGLVWSGSGKYAGREDFRRDISFSEFKSITRFDCEYFCLQKEIRSADRELLDEHHPVGIYENELSDFADTAALASEMDLVISVDTAAAHVAGALGKPVWILLPDPPDFLSMTEREDSPWYPTARLFRQPQMGDWASVIARVAAELKTRFPRDT